MEVQSLHVLESPSNLRPQNKRRKQQAETLLTTNRPLLSGSRPERLHACKRMYCMPHTPIDGGALVRGVTVIVLVIVLVIVILIVIVTAIIIVIVIVGRERDSQWGMPALGKECPSRQRSSTSRLSNPEHGANKDGTPAITTPPAHHWSVNHKRTSPTTPTTQHPHHTAPAEKKTCAPL